MLEPTSGDRCQDGLAGPDWSYGIWDSRPSASGVELELDSLDFLAFVEMVRESPAEARWEP